MDFSYTVSNMSLLLVGPSRIHLQTIDPGLQNQVELNSRYDPCSLRNEKTPGYGNCHRSEPARITAVAR